MLIVASLVLVHGFHEEFQQQLFSFPFTHPRRYRYSKILKTWADGFSASHQELKGVHTFVWSFKTADVLSGRHKLTDLAQELNGNLQAIFTPRLPKSAHGSDENPHRDTGSPSIVVVAHGVGAWVMRHLVGLPLSADYLPHIRGLVFVDALHVPHGDAAEKNDYYARYLGKLAKSLEVSLSKKETVEREVPRQMDSADEVFLHALEKLPKLAEGAGHEILSRVRTLLLEETLQACNKPTIPQYCSLFFFFLPLPPPFFFSSFFFFGLQLLMQYNRSPRYALGGSDKHGCQPLTRM